MKRLWAPWRMEYILNEIDKSSEGCIFCDLPSEKSDRKNLIVHRSEKCFVMLNKFPYNNGHLMVVPYQHTGNILDLDEEILLDMQKVIQLSANVLENEMNPHAMNIGMNLGRGAGAGIVDHLHYHIVPRWDGDTNFMPVISGTKVISESLTVSRDKLHAGFKKILNK